MELFLWDLEITAQLQSISDKAILKGGAAVQLHLPVEYQRGSVDIDIATELDETGLANLIQKTQANMNGVEFIQYIPKNPKPTSRLRTFHANTKSALSTAPLHVKIDFLLANTGLPTTELKSVPTFATDSSKITCFVPEVLVGDKILTLAKGSIGLEDLQDLPKQVYDISMLLSHSAFSDFSLARTTVQALVPLECEMFDKKVTCDEALNHIISFINSDLAPLDTHLANRELKTHFQKFDQFFTPASQKANYEEWVTRCLEIRFLANLLLESISKEMAKTECAKLLNTSKTVLAKLSKLEGADIVEARNILLPFQKSPLPYFKLLKSKPLKRVFWQVVGIQNVEAIASAV